jgi:hypothetical protein
MNFYIVKFQSTTKGININNALLINEEGDKILKFQHATEKGWKSQKPIFVDFAHTINDDNEIVISESTANELIACYKDVEVNIYDKTTPEQRASWANTSAWFYIAANFMNDPSDIR